MKVTFIVKSNQEIVPVYVRLRDGRNIDATCKTDIVVEQSLVKKGKVTFDLAKTSKHLSADAKTEIKRANKSLIAIREKINSISNLISTAWTLRKDYEMVNSQWLKEVLYPPKEVDVPTGLVEYFDFYFKENTSLQPSSIKKLKSIQSRIKKFEESYRKVYIPEINMAMRKKLENWCDKVKYHHNTKIKTIFVVYTMANHARNNGIPTNPELDQFTRKSKGSNKSLKYERTERQYLTFEELDKITETKMPNERMEIVRDWLLISCYTGQRISDFLKFNKNQIKGMMTKKESGEIVNYLTLRFEQQKTKKEVNVPLNIIVQNILKKRGGNFPPKITESQYKNEILYNRLIKEVCRLAGIDDQVKASIKNSKSNRMEMKKVPKYLAISSHVGRRSYATNYYGIINTALLIGVTGHSTESQYLDYVYQPNIEMAKKLAIELEDFHKHKEEEKLKTKKLSNEEKWGKDILKIV